MNTNGWLQLALYVVALVVITKPMGLYLMRVLDANGKLVSAPNGTLQGGAGNDTIRVLSGGFVAAVLRPLVPHGFYTTKGMTRRPPSVETERLLRVGGRHWKQST